MKTAWLLPVLVCASISGSCSRGGANQAGRQDVVLAREVDVLEAVVPRNATLQGVLRSHKASSDLADSIVGAVRAEFDPRRLKANQPYSLVTTLDGLFREFRYTMDADCCACITLKAMFRGRAEVIPGWYNIMAMYMTKLLPTTWTAAMAGKIMAKAD